MTNPRPPAIPSGVLGMLIFVASEAMFFAGLVSAFAVVRAGAVDWPPPSQPRLPVSETAVNTVALLASAACLFIAERAYRRDRRSAQLPLMAAMALGAAFVVLQGREWVALLSQGLTLTSSQLGSFFYLIVGLHALHAVAGLAVLGRAAVLLWRGRLSRSTFAASQVFWYFVVGLWPLLYWRVYG